MPNTEDFKAIIGIKLKVAAEYGLESIEITAGEIHKFIGGYPRKQNQKEHAMPSCCKAMKSFFKEGYDEIVNEPSKGNGANLTILYKFPR